MRSNDDWSAELCVNLFYLFIYLFIYLFFFFWGGAFDTKQKWLVEVSGSEGPVLLVLSTSWLIII